MGRSSQTATAFELATERHWHGLEQLIPWIALGVLTVASIYGVVDHIAVNYNSGPLDYRFADSWQTHPLIQRGWDDRLPVRQVASAWERSTAATKAANNAVAGLGLRNCS